MHLELSAHRQQQQQPGSSSDGTYIHAVVLFSASQAAVFEAMHHVEGLGAVHAKQLAFLQPL
jgi:hypothetical protein